MRKALIPALLLVLVSVVLGATVFREDVAQAASNLNVFVNNDTAHPVPVHEQGTALVNVTNTRLPVDAGFQTQVLLNRDFSDGERATIDIAAYKTFHVDFSVRNGQCFGSGATLLVLEATDVVPRLRIGADEACTGGTDTGQTFELAGSSLTFIVHIPNAGDTWRVAAFGRAN
jgi:hypothetical protein